MRFWKGILVMVAVVALATPAMAQVPAIGVFFDEDATQQFGTFEGGITQFHTAYVCAVNLDQMVGGMSFMLELDTAIHLTLTEYPNALAVGAPKDGVGIGFNNCRPAWGGTPVVGCILTLWTGTEMVSAGELRIVANPSDGGILIADCGGGLSAVSGLTSFLTITVDNESSSWGLIKSLYQ